MTARLANLPIAAVMAGTTFVAVTAFVLAYDGSAGAARDAGIAQAGWYPWCIEGVIVCASVATVQLRNRQRWRERAVPWFILLVFTAVSVAANVLHAWKQPGWQWWSLAFAAVPPLALPICVHLVLMVGRPRAEVTAISDDLDEELDALVKDTNGNGHGTKTKRAIETIAAYEAEHGSRPSISRLAGLAECSTGIAQKALTLTKGK